MKRIWRQWKVHGIPRCHAMIADGVWCDRLIWPWQKMGGNGEDAEHWDCMFKARWTFEQSMARDIRESL